MSRLWGGTYYDYFNSFKTIKRGVLDNKFDEPTYLSFWVEFEFNKAGMVFDFDDLPEGLLADSTKTYSAENYLKNIGYEERSKAVKVFRELLKDISQNNFWLIESVSGLNEVLNFDPKEGNVYRENDKKITIKFRETLDNRVYLMFDLLRKFSFDYVYMRTLLPDIMRYFTMRIYISELRQFHEPTKKNSLSYNENDNKLSNIYGKDTSKNKLQQFLGDAEDSFKSISDGSFEKQKKEQFDNFVNGVGKRGINSNNYFLKSLSDSLNIIVFEFSQCEFDFHNIKYDFVENLNVGQSPEAASITIDVKIGKLKEMASYNLFEYLIQAILGENSSMNSLTNPDILNNISNYSNKKSQTFGLINSRELFKKFFKVEDFDDVYKDKIFEIHLSDSDNIVKKKIGDVLIDALSEYALTKGKDLVSAQITSKYLGNAYGLSLSNIRNLFLQNPEAALVNLLNVLSKATSPEASARIQKNIGF